VTENIPLILLHPDDNILIAVAEVPSGASVMIDGVSVCVAGSIPIGHKLARHAMHVGTKILRYGAPIGSLTQVVARGDHVHLHNLASDYIATHDRETVTGA
jgi:hypothetical protein